MKIYAGIGSRETPPEILKIMTGLAFKLEKKGYVLRTGGAEGADMAFARGVLKSENQEIYLPWPGYNNWTSKYETPTKAAIDMAGTYHPAWSRCSQGARKLHGRNCHIVLGPDLTDPVNFIICWTPGAKRGGGTGQALRMVKDYPTIRIYDLANIDTLTKVKNFLNI